MDKNSVRRKVSMNIVWIGCHQEGLLAFKSILESGRKIKAFITLD